MVYIVNFNISRYLSDIKYIYDNNGKTNIDILLEDFTVGYTEWSVPQKAVPGDIVVFYCAKEASHNLGMATSHIPADYNQQFRTFVNQQKALYKKYSGFILGYGVVSSMPEHDDGSNWWFADINQLEQFITPIHIDDFRNYIFISRGNSITYLKDYQWEILKWLVNQKNPGYFPNTTAPDVSLLNQEFEKAVQKESAKPIDQLKKKAEKKVSTPVVSSVQTKVYHRDPTIAAYVKKRAKGYCQLCGQKAPFYDQDGEPYLECHHIVWLSNGGMDSPNNCVALCPNCHRKMHVINDLNDINVLKTKTI